MANEDHIARLNVWPEVWNPNIRPEVGAWNAWRLENPDIRPDLSGVDLYNANLSEANLSEAKLSEAKQCEPQHG